MTPIKADDIVEYALTFERVRFHHAGRNRETGVDCSGLAVVVYNHFGADIADQINYSTWDGFIELTRIMLTKFDRVKDGTINKGDLLLFRREEEMITNHIGLVIQPAEHLHEFLHSYDTHCMKMVCKERLDGLWRMRLYGVYRYKGIVY